MIHKRCKSQYLKTHILWELMLDRCLGTGCPFLIIFKNTLVWWESCVYGEPCHCVHPLCITFISCSVLYMACTGMVSWAIQYITINRTRQLNYYVCVTHEMGVIHVVYYHIHVFVEYNYCRNHNIPFILCVLHQLSCEVSYTSCVYKYFEDIVRHAAISQ